MSFKDLFTKDWWRAKCKNCNHNFSDWFVWSNGLRHCYICWNASGYKYTYLENGDKMDAINNTIIK